MYENFHPDDYQGRGHEKQKRMQEDGIIAFGMFAVVMVPVAVYLIYKFFLYTTAAGM